VSHFQATYTTVITTDVGGNGIGSQLAGLRTLANPWVLGGAPSAFARNAIDFPREYAASIGQRSRPQIGSNSEQVAFPAVVPLTMQVAIRGMGPISGYERAPRGEFWAQRRQSPRPLWFQISGVTRDKTSSAAIPGCTIDLFQTINDQKVATTISDGSGNFSFWVGDSVSNYYAVAYLSGSPDKAGTTVNLLKGS
jgi:hypothetical protein